MPVQREFASELELISSIARRAGGSTRKPQKRGGRGFLALGIGDDCAVLRPRPGRELLITTDLCLENVHFRRDLHPAESVGHRCLARGLSDLAAMGAVPEASFLSLALPSELRGRWMERFFDGFLALADRFRSPLAGGDLAAAPRPGGVGGPALIAADIVLVGSAPAHRSLLRSGALAGDTVYVTGWLGGAAAELRSLERSPRRFRRLVPGAAGHPHLYPEPRIAQGLKLASAGLATAAIDLSDGLSSDLAHLCQASGLAAEIDARSLPIAPGATLEDAVSGGEDYELLFTARPSAAIPARLAGAPVRAIGRMKKAGRSSRVLLIGADGRRAALPAGGWEHFR